ncbi:MAG: SDR family NAD(P)-dependent oxidoreductase, partial [Dermatophilaceae bacterium]
MRITRVVKDAATGSGSFVTIDDPADVIKLAARHAPLDMVEQFGIDRARDEALDTTTRLAIGAGFDALRDAGIPLTLRYKTTTIGSQLPDTWGLPEALRDDTGVIFASAFPGYDRFAEAIEEYALDRGRRDNLAALRAVRGRMPDSAAGIEEVDRLIAELSTDIEAHPYHFDRRFLFRALAMGHSQFAEIIGARGPNTQVNAACASTTQALSLAEDWIRSGRAKRVIVVSADDATAPHLLPWVTAGFLASGAAATDERVEDAATPFDRRRHGMIVGMGAAALVVESAESARERGLSPIAELLGALTANSAFHGTRLDVEHIGGVMESLIVQAERRGIKRHEIAARTMFMSHETYTPARGGSAAAEINALRRVFGEHADKVVITNTKGFTGHAMGAGMEDVVAVKALETGLVPPVPNYKEPDPDLGELNLSKGGRYEVEYALRLAAGFGSQIAMALLRRTPLPGGARRSPDGLGYAYRIVDRHAWQHWLDGLSGHADSTLEVDHRRLRVTDVGAPAVPVTPVTRVPVPYPGIAGSSPTLRGSSPIAPTIDYPKPFDHTAGAKVAAVGTAPAAAPAPSRQVPAPPVPPPTVAPQATEPPAAVPAAEAPVATGDAVLAKVTEIVAEMTGYPADLLDPDLDLEADLGVDTVKQAEVFAAVRQEYGVERDATLQLRDFPTLHHVAGWIHDKTGTTAPTENATGAQGTPAAPGGAMSGEPVHTARERHAPTMAMVEGDLAAIDSLPRRIPVPSLRPAASDCAETGVTLDGARVLVMLDEGGVGRSLLGRLEQAGATALTLEPGVSTDDLSQHLEMWLADGPISGVYWLAALDAESDHPDLDLEDWTEALRRRVKALYTTMRRLWDGSPFLVSATRLGGYHGYDAAGATSPMGGAVTGFTKSYKKERPDALVKAVDLAASRKTAALADLLVEETLRDPGVVEVGRGDDARWGVAFVERPFPPLDEDGSPDGPGGMTLGPDSVVVVTGAAGSIVSAITADLAAASGGTFHLLDLTPEPDRDDPDLTAFAADRETLKGTLAARMKAAGERPTPVAIEKEISRLERLASAAAAINAVESAGGTAHYHCVDLTDADAVAAVAERIAEGSAQIDVLLHAAGLEISRNLPEKEPREFDLVFDVKTTGWFTLWKALSRLRIGATVVFSSVAGRFGNQGQTDYAAANDLLCKITSSMRRVRPETRALALDWTAWGGIGMATRGSIPKIMELAGVQMLPPEAGVAWIRRELASGDHSGEVIVA